MVWLRVACCLLCFVGVVASLAGCGPRRPETIRVEGVVTLDGNPVDKAAVTFSPQDGGVPATGVTDADGKFTLKTWEAGDGALPGNHQVTVVKKEVTGVQADPDGLSGEVAEGGIQTTWLVPEKYSSRKTSELTVEVDKDMEQPVPLKLTSE